jgi:uncharacterized protein YggE
MKGTSMKALVFVLSIISFPLLSTVIPKQPHIYVEGHAEQEVIPDQIKISVSVTATNTDAEKSLKLFEATKALGIKQEQITATPIQIYPAIEHQNGKSVNVGTRVSRNIDILLHDLAIYPALNDALVEAEITSKISSTVELSDERSIKKGVLMLAVNDAKLKAAELAAIHGKEIKDVYSISEFKTRTEDAYNLRPNQEVYGQSYNAAHTRYRVPPGSSVFKIGKMRVTATVFVVYTME